MKKLLILGAGGQGKVVLDLALACDKWEDIKFLDDGKIGEVICGYPVIGGFDDTKRLKETFTHAMIAIGGNAFRMQLMKKVVAEGYHVPSLIHPSAIVSGQAQIGMGTVVMPRVVINSAAVIGNGCIINTGVIVEHDNVIGEGVHLSPGAILGGTVVIGDQTWIGLGANVINNITIGREVIVGAGSVVIRDIADGKKVMGVPAKEK